MNENLKKEAREAVDFFLEKPLSRRPDIDEIISDFINRATLAEKRRCVEIARNKVRPHHDWQKDEHGKECKDGCTYCCNAEGMTTGNNEACDFIATAIEKEEV